MYTLSMPLACSCFRNIAGLSTRFLWQRGWPRRLISEEHRENVPARAQAFIDESLGYLSQAWYLCFYPLLFGLIGASLNFRAVDPAIAGKAVTYAVLAVTVRIFTATGARVAGARGRARVSQRRQDDACAHSSSCDSHRHQLSPIHDPRAAVHGPGLD